MLVEQHIDFSPNWMTEDQIVALMDLLIRKPYMIFVWEEQCRNLMIAHDLDILVKALKRPLVFSTEAALKEILPAVVRGRVLVRFEPRHYIRFCDQNSLNPVIDMRRQRGNVLNSLDVHYDEKNRTPPIYNAIGMWSK